MNSLQSLEKWQEFQKHPTGAWLGFLNAVYWLGAGVTYLISAWVANRFGRKLGVYLGYVCLIIGVALLAGDHGPSFPLSRFFVGCAAGFFGNTVPLLINEVAYPTHRGIANALYMCGWYVGGTLCAFIAFGTRNYDGNLAWRIPAVLQFLLPAVALPGLMLTPESPRWLVSIGRTEEAREILSMAHAGGDTTSSLVQQEMLDIMGTLNAERKSTIGNGYTDMLKSPGNRHRLFISITIGIFSQWVGNGVVSYYLPLILDSVGVKDPGDQMLISGCLQIWNLVFAVAAASSVERLGRRPLFLTSAATMLVAFILVIAFSAIFEKTGNASFGLAVIPFLFIFFAGYDIAL
jgi:MFS family permease